MVLMWHNHCMMITDNVSILHLQMCDYIAYTRPKGKLEENMFLKGYEHLVQPISFRVQTGTHHSLFLLVIFYIVHLKLCVYSAYIVTNENRNAKLCKDYVHCPQRIYIIVI